MNDPTAWFKPEKWGRVVITGGVDWPRLGKKDNKGTPEGAEDLLSPHILRAINNIKVTRIISGCTAYHMVAIDVYGNAHLIGRNLPSATLGLPSETIEGAPSTIDNITEDGSAHTFDWVHKVVATKLGGANRGRVGVKARSILDESNAPKSAAGEGIKEEGTQAQPAPEASTSTPAPAAAPPADPDHYQWTPEEYDTSPDAPTRIVDAACGRHHTLLVGSCGRVWGSGKNEDGRVGLKINEYKEVRKFTQIRGGWETDKARIVQVSAGVTFSLYLGSNGFIYASGSYENGQLGNGSNGARIVKAGKTSFDAEERPKLIKPFTKNKIIKVACGAQHALAMDEEGFVWGWGYAGYSRLGLGDQKDRMIPTLIPQFSGANRMTRARDIFAGPSCSVVVDAQRMYQIAGKWKMTGEGSGGSPNTYFKHIPELVSCKILRASIGGNGLFCTSPLDDDGNVQSIAWGQNCANGELGLGPDQNKNSNKPVEVLPLNGMKVIDVAGSAATTYWLVHPNDKFSDLDRWPEQALAEETCLVCHVHKKDNSPLECEKCDQPYHKDCLTPPLSEIPSGEWFCPTCLAQSEDPDYVTPLPEQFVLASEPHGAHGSVVAPASGGGKGKGKVGKVGKVVETVKEVGGKRKAGAQGGAVNKKKK